MTIEIKVPQLPESVSDATLVAWHKSVGEGVSRDENLVDLETDKVVLEVPSPVDGVVGRIVRDSGETVISGELLGVIEEGEVEAAEAPPSEAEKAPVAEESVASTPDATKLSPAARRVAEEEQAEPTGESEDQEQHPAAGPTRIGVVDLHIDGADADHIPGLQPGAFDQGRTGRH